MPSQMTFVPTVTLSRKAIRQAIKALETRRRSLTLDAKAWDVYRSGKPTASNQRQETIQAIDELKQYLDGLHP